MGSRMAEAFAELQHSFAAAVRGEPVELPIRAATAARAESGLAVYRNNVMSSLIKVVAARFPAVRRLLGEDCFLESVRRFIAAELRRRWAARAESPPTPPTPYRCRRRRSRRSRPNGSPDCGCCSTLRY